MIRPSKSNVFGIDDRIGLPRLTRLRVNFSDLREHRFDHRFNCPNPLCKCSIENESTEHFLLRCLLYSTIRKTLLSNLAIAVNDEILNLPHDHLTSIILYGSTSFNLITNKTILIITLHFIKASGRKSSFLKQIMLCDRASLKTILLWVCFLFILPSIAVQQILRIFQRSVVIVILILLCCVLFFKDR